MQLIENLHCTVLCVGCHLAPESAAQIYVAVLLGRLLLTAAFLPKSPCLALESSRPPASASVSLSVSTRLAGYLNSGNLLKPHLAEHVWYTSG